MRRRDLILRLEAVGFVFERNGANHDIYRRGYDIEKVPRHREIKPCKGYIKEMEGMK